MLVRLENRIALQAEVIGWEYGTQAIIVKTRTGRRLAITYRSDEDLGGKAYYPIRLGYASTIMKFQGAELPHVTIFLEHKHVPAAAYTAMSRVKRAKDCLIGGWVTPDHFKPAM